MTRYQEDIWTCPRHTVHKLYLCAYRCWKPRRRRSWYSWTRTWGWNSRGWSSREGCRWHGVHTAPRGRADNPRAQKTCITKKILRNQWQFVLWCLDPKYSLVQTSGRCLWNYQNTYYCDDYFCSKYEFLNNTVKKGLYSTHIFLNTTRLCTCMLNFMAF